MSKINSVVNEMDKVEISETKEDLQISKEVEEKVEEYPVTNFAFFGIDTRSKNGLDGRSDCIMVVSIDKNNNKIKLSSIMRDTYVDIPSHGMDKITHAYAFGGPQLAISTINKNFQLDINNFATVNFFDLEKIIDTLGGVSITIDKSELKYINGYIDEIANISGENSKHISAPGTYDLTGQQAVAYSRIRYTAGGDFKRTERQREVLSALLLKISKMDKAKFISMVPKISKYVTTNMDINDILSTGVDALQSDISNIDTERFPTNENAIDKTIDGVYYLTTDLELTSKQMFDYIYEDIKPSDNNE
jgi:LCP family protein required for cell wall assembly